MTTKPNPSWKGIEQNMTRKRALALFRNSSDWLRYKVDNNEECICNACLLCAYNFLAQQRRETLDEAIAIFEKHRNEPMTGNVVILELQVLRDTLVQKEGV